VLCQAIVVPPLSFFKEFDIPRSVRKEFFNAPESRQTLRNMFGDVRMLCYDVGLMNPLARLMWRICKIDGSPSRYRNEPQRAALPTSVAARDDQLPVGGIRASESGTEDGSRTRVVSWGG